MEGDSTGGSPASGHAMEGTMVEGEAPWMGMEVGWMHGMAAS